MSLIFGQKHVQVNDTWTVDKNMIFFFIKTRCGHIKSWLGYMQLIIYSSFRAEFMQIYQGPSLFQTKERHKRHILYKYSVWTEFMPKGPFSDGNCSYFTFFIDIKQHIELTALWFYTWYFPPSFEASSLLVLAQHSRRWRTSGVSYTASHHITSAAAGQRISRG